MPRHVLPLQRHRRHGEYQLLNPWPLHPSVITHPDAKRFQPVGTVRPYIHTYIQYGITPPLNDSSVIGLFGIDARHKQSLCSKGEMRILLTIGYKTAVTGDIHDAL